MIESALYDFILLCFEKKKERSLPPLLYLLKKFSCVICIYYPKIKWNPKEKVTTLWRVSATFQPPISKTTLIFRSSSRKTNLSIIKKKDHFHGRALPKRFSSLLRKIQGKHYKTTQIDNACGLTKTFVIKPTTFGKTFSVEKLSIRAHRCKLIRAIENTYETGNCAPVSF